MNRLKESLENYLKKMRRLNGKKNISQVDVDYIVRSRNMAAEMPKELSWYTLNIIKGFFEQKRYLPG